MDYFLHLKMERARALLEGTSLMVKEIAAALGYADQFYFSRAFKSVNGAAPTEYRHACRFGACVALLQLADVSAGKTEQSKILYEHSLQL